MAGTLISIFLIIYSHYKPKHKSSIIFGILVYKTLRNSIRLLDLEQTLETYENLSEWYILVMI